MHFLFSIVWRYFLQFLLFLNQLFWELFHAEFGVYFRVIDFEKFDDEGVTGQLRGAEDAAEESRKTFFAVVHWFAVKIRFPICRAERRDETLAVAQAKYIPNGIEISLEPFDCPIKLGRTAIGFSVYSKNKQLGLENEKVCLLLNFALQNTTFYIFGILSQNYVLIRVYVNIHVLLFIDGQLSFIHPFRFHQDLLFFLFLFFDLRFQSFLNGLIGANICIIFWVFIVFWHKTGLL
jgi:hypothetical protein